MNIKLKELKEELKTIAGNIRKLKADTKASQKAKIYVGLSQSMLLRMKRDYRHKHVAYSLLRGKTMEQIEKSTKPWPFTQPLDLNLIKIIREKYEETIYINS